MKKRLTCGLYRNYRGAVLFVFSIALVALTGCATAKRHAVPENLASSAHLAGLDNVRLELDVSNTNVIHRFSEFLKGWNASGGADHRLNVLSLSGGGENGAYGAGLLCGWTEAKSRPQFDLVTGISTGSLIAPLAFLGTNFDPQLRHGYTEIKPSQVFLQRGFFGVLKHRDALADSAPLKQLIAEILGEKELAAIAREHRKGRRLLVMTTNLDAQKPVIWDIGAIACSSRTNALKVIHDVLLASSSIPVVFPPVLFHVEAGGAPYDELHVDGGVMAQVFGGMVLLTDAVQQNPGTVTDFYLVRNGRLSPDYEATQRKLGSIAGRSISTMMKIQGVNDVMRLWALCRVKGGNFHYVSIPEDFQTELKEPFDPEYMKALFKVGYDQGRNGVPWQRAPAGLDEVEQRLGSANSRQ